MIFISHNSKDKPFVDPLARELEKDFGRDFIFYDSWSIAYGDNIIGKMNEGIERFTHFFYFISVNSLKSGMVNLEWQAALAKVVKNPALKFVPVRCDHSAVPALIAGIKRIDFYENGLHATVRDIIALVRNEETASSHARTFQNLFYNVQIDGDDVVVDLHAVQHTEQINQFAFIFANDHTEFRPIANGYLQADRVEHGGRLHYLLTLPGGLVPGVPQRVYFLPRPDVKLELQAIYHRTRVRPPSAAVDRRGSARFAAIADVVLRRAYSR